MRLLIIITIALFISITSSYSQIAIIGNKDISSSLDASKLKSLYNLDMKKIGSSSVVLFDYKDDNDMKVKFYSSLGTSSSDIKKVWLKAKLTGAGTPPTPVGSDEEMINKVKSTSGGIGYINSSKVTGDVKVLFEIK